MTNDQNGRDYLYTIELELLAEAAQNALKGQT